MQVGVTFPQNEITADPGAVRDYAQAAQDLGYSHLLAYDHMIGADITNRPNWNGPYTHEYLFHEVFVLFGYLAAVAPTLELVSNVIILPQRQTVLVAKQAAEVDVLTNGKSRLGIGLGWNEVEYQALNESFANRAARIDEQIKVLRALFTEPVVTFHGKWHHIQEAGILPLPVQRPIPLWLGGGVEATLRRVVALGDGWFPQGPPDDDRLRMLERLHELAIEAGRDPSTIGIEARVSIADKTPEDWASEVERWQGLGATHIGVNTMRAGFTSPQDHIDAIERFREVLPAPASVF